MKSRYKFREILTLKTFSGAIFSAKAEKYLYYGSFDAEFRKLINDILKKFLARFLNEYIFVKYKSNEKNDDKGDDD